MTLRLLTVLIWTVSAVFARDWSGLLVDANCYASEERNVNKNTSNVEHDVNLEVHACLPNRETKAFALILPDSDSLKLDSVGNARAAQLVANTGKKALLWVTVTGEIRKNTILTSSISASR